jgi:hypothetical protein
MIAAFLATLALGADLHGQSTAQERLALVMHRFDSLMQGDRTLRFTMHVTATPSPGTQQRERLDQFVYRDRSVTKAEQFLTLQDGQNRAFIITSAGKMVLYDSGVPTADNTAQLLAMVLKEGRIQRTWTERAPSGQVLEHVAIVPAEAGNAGVRQYTYTFRTEDLALVALKVEMARTTGVTMTEFSDLAWSPGIGDPLLTASVRSVAQHPTDFGLGALELIDHSTKAQPANP